MNQTEFDLEVENLVLEQIRFANNTAILRRQGDIAHIARETELMMLQNVISCLKFYDVTSLLLTDTEISSLIEIGKRITSNWPRP